MRFFDGGHDFVVVRNAEERVYFGKLLFQRVYVSLRQTTGDDNFLTVLFVFRSTQYFVYGFVFGVFGESAGVDNDNVRFVSSETGVCPAATSLAIIFPNPLCFVTAE